MEPWGAALYADPCGQCGFDWGLEPGAAVQVVARAAESFAKATREATGDERLDGWSVAEYTSHVGDNLRQWAERVQAARLAGSVEVAGYDPDELARARGYASIPLAVALWSLDVSSGGWVDVLASALDEGVALQHATRGTQRAQDIARNNAHDVSHHLWDVGRILGR